MGFYENNIWIYAWPTQPPLVNLLYGFDNWLYINLLETFRLIGNMIVRYHLAPGHMIWWFEFTKWFDTAKVSSESVFSTGYLVSIKLLPIFSDLGIAGIIYWISRRVVKSYSSYTDSHLTPLIFPAVYLLSPFTWYLSSLWGQYDGVAFLPLLIAFLLESKRKLGAFTPFLIATSIAIKPTGLLLLPLFIFIYFRNKHKIYEIVSAGILISVLFWATTKVFTEQDVIHYSSNVLYGKIFLKAASRLSANAFNFWRIIQSSGVQTQDAIVLFLPAYFWSIFAYLFLNTIAFTAAKKISTQTILRSVFIVSAGSWLFMTNMLDRYFFAGVVSGLIVCIYDIKLLKYWFFLSLIFALNLFNQWWFPESFTYLKTILLWQNTLSTKILAVVNIFIFWKMLSMFKKTPISTKD